MLTSIFVTSKVQGERTTGVGGRGGEGFSIDLFLSKMVGGTPV